jgi:hypothetical protein
MSSLHERTRLTWHRQCGQATIPQQNVHHGRAWEYLRRGSYLAEHLPVAVARRRLPGPKATTKVRLALTKGKPARFASKFAFQEGHHNPTIFVGPVKQCRMA